MRTTVGRGTSGYKRGAATFAAAILLALLIAPAALAGPLSDATAAEPCNVDPRILKNEPALCSSAPVSYAETNASRTQGSVPRTSSGVGDIVWIGAALAAAAAAATGGAFLLRGHRTHPVG